MTKEEILRKTLGMIPFVHIMGSHESICHSMDEFAKQQAKDFAKWTAVNLWSVHGDNWYPYLDEDNPISADELYNQFIESQNK